ncbi:MAG TPA: hypothetical protein VMW27_07095 [Thermoanaerobaculia bacterium]|nr:hypothetical protein [Thermoanaerobaculia bacterium]
MRSRTVLAALVCSFLLGLSPLAAAPVIERGIDTFSTPADGRTVYDFALSPIPAGFFCKGSKPFTGRVAFKGLPLSTGVLGQLGAADTVVERLDDAVFDAKGLAVTRIQFRALSLVSIAPVKTSCGSFHAYVSLGGEQRVTTMRIHRTQESGGTFAAPLAADVRLTFIPVKPARGKSARKLELNGSFTFPATSIPWSLTDGAKGLDAVVVDTNGDLAPDTRLPGPSNFLPGLSPDKALNLPGSCCSEYVCHTDSTGKQHCSWTIPPGCMHAQICMIEE